MYATHRNNKYWVILTFPSVIHLDVKFLILQLFWKCPRILNPLIVRPMNLIKYHFEKTSKLKIINSLFLMFFFFIYLVSYMYKTITIGILYISNWYYLQLEVTFMCPHCEVRFFEEEKSMHGSVVLCRWPIPPLDSPSGWGSFLSGPIISSKF